MKKPMKCPECLTLLDSNGMCVGETCKWKGEHRAPVPVIFRMDKYGKEKQVTAVFPTLCANHHGHELTCYAHIGQHSACSMGWYLQRTRPALPAEYEALRRELTRIGYVLIVGQKITPQMRKEFKAEQDRINQDMKNK